MKNYEKENYGSHNKENIIVIPIDSYVKRIKFSDLGSKILITKDLKYNCPLIVSKNWYWTKCLHEGL